MMVHCASRGVLWHVDEGCRWLHQPGAKRQVSIQYAEAGGRKPCPSCAKHLVYRTIGRSSSSVKSHRSSECHRAKLTKRGRYVHVDAAAAAGIEGCKVCRETTQ